LLASLDGALKAFELGNLKAGANELGAFQNKLQAQVAPKAPALAETLNSTAQQIIDALANPGPARSPAGTVTRVSRGRHGKLKIQFAAQRGQTLIVQASANLLDWEPIGLAKDQGDGSFKFEDAHASPLSHRFYRIVPP